MNLNFHLSLPNCDQVTIRKANVAILFQLGILQESSKA
jgi:hypothetical protein